MSGHLSLNPDICSMLYGVLVAGDGKEHRQSSFSEELVGLVDRQLGTQVSLHCE